MTTTMLTAANTIPFKVLMWLFTMSLPHDRALRRHAIVTLRRLNGVEVGVKCLLAGVAKR
jgi:hypothetical protein